MSPKGRRWTGGPTRAPTVADSCPVSETPAPQPDTSDESTDSDVPDLESLVGTWLTVPDAAELIGAPLSHVRQLIADREVLAARIGERRVAAIPAKFLDATGPRPELRGTFTVLADGGMDDDEIIAWLHTPDATLPIEGAPIDAILAGFKTEIRRRAQELAL